MTTQPSPPRYQNPTPTVDVIIELADRPGTVVLIERANPPLGWALPGGFVDRGEWVADAAIREAKEETGLDVELGELFHVYSDPARDPRQHTMSTVFVGRAAGAPTGSDDAARAGVFALDALPPLVFDHATILADYAAYRATGRRPPPRR
jgi:8-oxo-dGTP diphosphatase